MLRDTIRNECLRKFKRAYVGFILTAIFVLSPSPVLASGSCYVGIDQSSGAPEFIQCEREADCIDNSILDIDCDTLLVGDGEPILEGAKARLEELVATFPA